MDFTQEWPASYMGQRLLIQQIEDQVNLLESVNTPVIVNAETEPSQYDFEQAYIRQTGRKLPIQPGTKLLWRNILTNRIKQYTTTYDEIPYSEITSGVVRNLFSPQPGAFRLLSTHAINEYNGGVYGVQVYANPYNTTQRSIAFGANFDQDFWSQEGLEQIWVLYQLHAIPTAGTYYSGIYFDGVNTSHGSYSMSARASRFINTSNVSVQELDTLAPFNLGTNISGVSNSVGYYVYGWAVLDKPIDVRSTEDFVYAQSPSGWWVTVTSYAERIATDRPFGTEIDATDIEVAYGSLQTDTVNRLEEEGLYLPVTGSDEQFTGYVEKFHSKAWVYGLFSSNTGNWGK